VPTQCNQPRDSKAAFRRGLLFNSDQGAQSTGAALANKLDSTGVRISHEWPPALIAQRSGDSGPPLTLDACHCTVSCKRQRRLRTQALQCRIWTWRHCKHATNKPMWRPFPFVAQTCIAPFSGCGLQPPRGRRQYSRPKCSCQTAARSSKGYPICRSSHSASETELKVPVPCSP
jgi:hypothetical protein